ncbi:TonB-dependent receptor domain-containing protein [Sphingomonas arenae]|uniref:TonB-dependent receptor domain-containing protein n=1 Tax=Sphingomonas arenae TaxID=2812555 RepID=UPI0019675A4C
MDSLQGSSSSQTEDQVITVTASRSGEAVEELPVAVTVLDEAAIQRQLQTSSDILRALDFTVPGLNLSTGGRSQCLTRVRGRVPAFQINGVPANQDLRPSNCNSAFQISPFALERVEVVRGATALFGAGAPGGIINLITRRARGEQLEVDAVVQTGFNTEKLSGTFQTDLYAGVGRRAGAFDFYVGAGYQDYAVGRDPNGDRVVGTAFDSYSLNGSAGLSLSPDFRVRLTATHYNENPGTEYNVSGADVDAGVPLPRVIRVTANPFRAEGLDRLTTVALSLEADRLVGHKLQASAYGQWQRFQQRANFQDANGGEPDFFSDDRENSTIGTRLTLARQFGIGPGRLGLEYGLDWRRDRLIRLLLDPADTGVVTGFIAPEVFLSQTGLFAQASYDLGRFRLTGGARQEFYRGRIGDKLADRGLSGTGNPGRFAKADLALYNAGLVYDLSSAAQLYLSYNEGAELTQLGRASRRATDPSLISPEPAKSRQVEIGARGRLGPVRLTAAAFRSKSDAASLVQPDPSCAGESFCPLIPLRVPQKVWGAEATADWKVSDQLDLGALFTWQRGEIFDENFNRYIPFGTDIVSPTRLAIRAEWRPIDRLSLGAQASYSAKASFFSAAEQEFGLVNTPSLFLVDASVGYRVGPGEVTAAISNLFNERYEYTTLAAGGFTPSLAEGRRLTLGYRLKLGR